METTKELVYEFLLENNDRSWSIKEIMEHTQRKYDIVKSVLYKLLHEDKVEKEFSVASKWKCKPNPENKEITPITAELVQELRNKGRWDLAYKLIKAHQNNLKKNKRQELNEINRRDKKIEKAILYNYGLCTICRQPLKTKKYKRCLECRIKNRRYR
jgi:hypothetical protein